MKNILLSILSISLAGGPLLAAVPQQSLFTDVLVHKPVSIDTEKLAAAELIISQKDKWSFCQQIIDLHNKGKLIERNIIPYLESKNIRVSGATYHATSLIVSAATTASNMKKRVFGKGLAMIMEGESNLTAENVTELINAYRKSENADVPCDKDMIIELLKERKNTLIKEMNDEMWKQINKPSLGDIMTEDYAIFATEGLMFFFGARFLWFAKSDYEVGMIQGIGLSMAVMAIQKLREYRFELRSREQEMNYIDEIMNYIDEIIEKLESLHFA